MSVTTFYIDPDSELSLQNQIRQRLIEAILGGTFPSGVRLPSSRKLADQLGVARNTVVLVYQQLLADSYIVSRERSGIYVNDEILEGYGGYRELSSVTEEAKARAASWKRRLKTRLPIKKSFRCPPNWQLHPYPFMDGRFDKTLYPIAEWREATRLALGAREIHEWSNDSGDVDDPMLIEEIRTKVLPRRGIQAGPDEILITIGAQQALHLVTQLLTDQGSIVAVEEPGYPDVRQLLAWRGARVIHQPVDGEGMVVDERLDPSQIVFVTPSHQFPTAVTMSMARRKALLQAANRRDFLIIEDDFQCETNYHDQSFPSLRSMDDQGRVIYLASLSKVLAPGLRLGFIVAAPEVIAEARGLRRLMVRHPPRNNQRTAAFFLSLGHYDTTMVKLGKIFRERMTALRDGLNYYLPQLVAISPLRDGTAYWVEGPAELDASYLAREASKRGILIEPAEDYFTAPNSPRNVFRMGVTSLTVDKIREGVAALAQLIQDLTEDEGVNPVIDRSSLLSGAELHDVISGATLLCKTVYGDPYTIEVLADGRLIGKAGYANEDCDEGRWWIEGDYWCRQWNYWVYGEVARFLTVVTDNQIKWYKSDMRLFHRFVIVRPDLSA
jgi:GntR family transcriptional regulator/MocR family aminotransferase